MTGRDEMTMIDLHAYADELLELEPERKARVEAWLESNPQKRALVQAIRRQNEEIAALFDAGDERASARLSEAFGPRESGKKLRPASAGMIAASLAAGVLGGYLFAGVVEQDAPRAVSKAETGAQLSVSAAEGASAAMQGAPAFELSRLAPDLSAAGFMYEGHEARRDTSGALRELRLLYRARQGTVAELSVKARAVPAERKVTETGIGGRTRLEWTDGVFDYRLVSNAAAAELENVKRTLGTQPAGIQLHLDAPETMQQVDAQEPPVTQGAPTAPELLPEAVPQPVNNFSSQG
ncbi:putative transmembrane anti-sigma factor [Tepidicaulis marinus]|uniref:Putative transmembrane anti-sigma factor n=1 Tax=Tepidicaulis marinus TaxID=1333998 RepID=A0A081BA90_9HYPH|nr:hypothetical protein [Tepidicaulis marinus]GAK44958.1 putative transmembrane anti-sigma factor [Tepidicaulis marinus]